MKDWLLKGEQIRAYEARGTPAKVSLDGFKNWPKRVLPQAEIKFWTGLFKKPGLNFSNESGISFLGIQAEKSLGFLALIPDTAIQRDAGAVCIEYHWRSGDFLRPSNRSDVAGYALHKIRDYVRQLEWTRD